MQEKILALFQKIPKSYYLPILLLVCGVILFSIGLIQFFNSSVKNDTSSLSTQETTATMSANSTFGLIKVDVEGAVVHPGVYSLQNSARVQDALVAAGGLSASADRALIQQRVN